MAELPSCSFQQSSEEPFLGENWVCHTNNLAEHLIDEMLWEHFCSSSVEVLLQNKGKEASI